MGSRFPHSQRFGDIGHVMYTVSWPYNCLIVKRVLFLFFLYQYYQCYIVDCIPLVIYCYRRLIILVNNSHAIVGKEWTLWSPNKEENRYLYNYVYEWHNWWPKGSDYIPWEHSFDHIGTKSLTWEHEWPGKIVQSWVEPDIFCSQWHDTVIVFNPFFL